jgi:hypothetical protein
VAFGKLEQASQRGLLERYSQLGSDFTEASRTLFWIFFTKIQPYIGKTISAHTKSTKFDFYDLHFVTLSL